MKGCLLNQRNQMAQPRKELLSTYGQLTVSGDVPYKGKSRQVTATCSCGKEVVVSVANLRSGNTTSCGCVHQASITTHGQSQTRLYRIWRGMWERCTNSQHEAFDRYGGSGISVTPAWSDVENFVAWASISGYADGLTLDRKENTKGYSPDNCRWSTRVTQQRNRSGAKGSSSQYIGVSFFKLTSKWKAHIRHDGKLVHLGYHFTELAAAKARDQYIINQQLKDFTMNGVLP